MQTLAQIVKAFSDALIVDKRQDGTEFIRLADDKPEWMFNILRDAHGEMMPDDLKYKMIGECVEKLYEALQDDSENFDSVDIGEIADSLVDIYNWDRLKWVSSHLTRAYYCDDAQSEGLLSSDADMFQRLGMGQYMEYSEILNFITSKLLEVFENQDSEE